MSNNWRTPKSEKMQMLERLMQRQLAEICALHPHLRDDELTDALLADPQVAALFDDALARESARYRAEEEIDGTHFVYGPEGKRRLIRDTKLREMSDQELAAWAQQTGVMFAQLKAHLAERFPETKLKVVR
jgi:hypothetical protein